MERERGTRKKSKKKRNERQKVRRKGEKEKNNLGEADSQVVRRGCWG